MEFAHSRSDFITPLASINTPMYACFGRTDIERKKSIFTLMRMHPMSQRMKLYHSQVFFNLEFLATSVNFKSKFDTEMKTKLSFTSVMNISQRIFYGVTIPFSHEPSNEVFFGLNLGFLKTSLRSSFKVEHKNIKRFRFEAVFNRSQRLRLNFIKKHSVSFEEHFALSQNADLFVKASIKELAPSLRVKLTFRKVPLLENLDLSLKREKAKASVGLDFCPSLRLGLGLSSDFSSIKASFLARFAFINISLPLAHTRLDYPEGIAKLMSFFTLGLVALLTIKQLTKMAISRLFDRQRVPSALEAHLEKEREFQRSLLNLRLKDLKVPYLEAFIVAGDYCEEFLDMVRNRTWYLADKSKLVLVTRMMEPLMFSGAQILPADKSQLEGFFNPGWEAARVVIIEATRNIVVSHALDEPFQVTIF